MTIAPMELSSENPRVVRRRLREQIFRRAPSPGACTRVRVTYTTPARDPFFEYTRVTGSRDDVLDYAAFLFATDTGWGETALDVAGIERDDGEELTLLLARPV